jgi:hypothetical protein
MNPAVRTTIVYGMISALAAMPLAGVLATPLGRVTAVKLVLWAMLSGYAVLLSRWSGRRLASQLFPLLLLLGVAFWPGVYRGFCFIAVGVLAWVRSGICFDRSPLRAVIAETLTLAGGACLVVFLAPTGAIAWALAIWLFWLIQSLYFFLVPLPASRPIAAGEADPFTQACREVQRILDD